MTDDFDVKAGADPFPSEFESPDASGKVPAMLPGDALDEFPIAIAPLPVAPPPVAPRDAPAMPRDAPAMSRDVPAMSRDVPAMLSGDALDEFPVAFAEPSPSLGIAEPFDDDRDGPAVGERGRQIDGLVDGDENGSRSSPAAIWTVAAALLIGLACGFGGGYLVGGRLHPVDRIQQGGATTTVAPTVAPPATPPAASAPPPRNPARSDGRNDARNDADRSTSAPPASAGRDGARDADGVQLESDQSAATSLLVRSTPAGAQVLIDGRDRGRTPAAIRGLAAGTHRLRVVRDGYVTEDRSITIAAGRPSPGVNISLERSPVATASAGPGSAAQPKAVDDTIVGSLNVESRPADAQVFLDGTLVGTTPFVSDRIPAGSHAIRLERDGYRRWVASVWIVSGERSRVTASLEQ